MIKNKTGISCIQLMHSHPSSKGKLKQQQQEGNEKKMSQQLTADSEESGCLSYEEHLNLQI